MSLPELLDAALSARAHLVDEAHRTAFRLFNGFVEGAPALALDVYARTLVIHDHAPSPEGDRATAEAALAHVQARLPWLRAAVWKVRRATDPAHRNGCLLAGTPVDLDTRVTENGVAYAIDLTMQRDASLYLDTRALRAWAKDNLAGQRVLNTFAYTGSLGVAARAAPAREVVHTDRNRAFLDVAKRSYALNGFPVRRADFIAGDFFDVSARLRREGALYDCVFLDPPFFSDTAGGRVDLARDARRVIDKVRPLVSDGGRLAVVNNALFLSGRDWMGALEALCADGFLSIEAHLPVPEDFTATPATRRSEPPLDPAPFTHTTRITLLRAKRKDGRRASR